MVMRLCCLGRVLGLRLGLRLGLLFCVRRRLGCARRGLLLATLWLSVLTSVLPLRCLLLLAGVVRGGGRCGELVALLVLAVC